MPRGFKDQITSRRLFGIVVKDDDWWAAVHAPCEHLDCCIDHTRARIVHVDRSGVGLLELSKCLQRVLKRCEGIGVHGQWGRGYGKLQSN